MTRDFSTLSTDLNTKYACCELRSLLVTCSAVQQTENRKKEEEKVVDIHTLRLASQEVHTDTNAALVSYTFKQNQSRNSRIVSRIVSRIIF